MLSAGSPEKVDPFFFQLDQGSKNLRKVAQNFANYLATNSFSFPEKEALLKAIHEVALAKIETIDVAINKLKEHLMLANTKLENLEIKKILGKHPRELEVFARESTVMINAMHALLDKAIKLSVEKDDFDL